VIHVVTIGHLRGTTVAATVMRDDAIAVIEEEHHLCVPVIARERPTMTEHDRLTFPPVLIENLGAVFGGDRGHREPPASMNCVDRAKNRNQGSAGASVRCDIRAKLGQLPVSYC
jgi:hypothetical protein